MYLRAVSLFCKDLVSLKSCVEQLQFPHEKRQFQSLRMHCTVVLPYFLLISVDAFCCIQEVVFLFLTHI
jgi:hypothetical protein